MLRNGIILGALLFILAGYSGCRPRGGDRNPSGSTEVTVEPRPGTAEDQAAGPYSRATFLSSLEEALALDSQIERYGRFAELALALPAGSYPETMDAMMAQDIAFRHLDLPIYLLIRWMEIDAEAGARWMAVQPMTESFSIVVENVFFNWGLNQPRKALALAERTGDAGFRLLAVDSALRALKRRDPERARAEEQRLEGMLREAPRMDSIALLTRLDPDAAWRQLNQAWTGGEKRHRSWRSFFEVLAESDPRRALSLLSDLPDDSLEIGMGMAVFGVWAKTDPQGALIEAMRYPDPYRSNAVVMEVIESVSEVDPTRGLALAGTIEDPNLRRQAVSRAIQNLDPNQPGVSLASIGQLQDASYRQMAYSQFLPRLAMNDPEGTFAWMQANLDGRSLAQAMVSVASSQAQVDPARAASWIDQLPPGQYRSRTLQQVARIWADQDPMDAFTWAISLPNAGDRARAVGSLAPALARADVNQAMLLAAEMEPGQDRAALENQVAQYLAREDPVAAMEWTLGIPGVESRDRATNLVLYEWARQDPESAFQFAMSETDSRSRNNHLSRVASTWASQDPEAAVETLAAFSDRGLEPYLFNGALSQWINGDQDGASSWLMHEAPAAVRDQGLAMLVEERLQHDAPAAVADAVQIGGEEQRRQALRQILAWSQYFDPAFGRALLQNDSTLSFEDRIALENEFGERLDGP